MATVLHVTQPTEAGVAAYVEALGTDQVARGWRVTVACPPSGRLGERLDAAGVERVAWPAARSPTGQTVGEWLRLRRIVDRVGPDVVHLHSSKAGLAGRLAVRGEVPTLFQPHGWSWLAGGRALGAASLRWERYASRWTTLSVCVGEGEAETARRGGVRAPSCVVRSGVDLTRFRPGDRRRARAELELPAAAPLVVCVGRLAYQKGQDRLLAAWPSIVDQHPSAWLALVGDGPLLAATRQRRLPGVILPGATADPRPWYHAADVVALPSRWEGVPLTLLEAMATGRSVVATAVPGIAEVLPAEAGALVASNDVAALAEAVNHRLARPDLAAAEGAAGYIHALTTLDIQRTHAELARITQGLTGQLAEPKSAR